MSFSPGGSDVGGSNEDGLADEAAKSQHARIPLENSDAEDLDEGHTGLFEGEDIAQDGIEDSIVGNESGSEDLSEVDDIPQLSRQRPASPIDAGLELAAPTTPLRGISPSSPVLSDSIPDDTPSFRGSLPSSPLASPSRGLSPAGGRRKIPSRTGSGALKPFERRFTGRASLSPTHSSRGASPGVLTPRSRHLDTSSHLSLASSFDNDSDTETLQAPWDVVRWTKLRQITGQAFSEAGKRNFGRPTSLAVSALIAIGTSKGLVLGFDYQQTLKIIIGQGTKAAESGAVTALAIAADYSTIAAGHANGSVFTWEINRPSRPFLYIPPLPMTALQQTTHSDGHTEDAAILHIGFLGTRHTALVSADAGGMAFSHLASRGLGAVSRQIKTTRLLGRYPSSDPQIKLNRKPSSVLAFAPLPLGNVEQSTDTMGLTAMLTPYLLVIVSTTPIAQTQHKAARPKELTPHGTLSGCLAWFPAVKLKSTSKGASEKSVSDTKLVYCWSNVLTVLDITTTETGDTTKSSSLEFHPRSRWRADEAIVAVNWLSRSVLGVLTISQRLLIVEDGSLQVTDSIDLLHRHIYHEDLFSKQLHAIVEQLDPADPSMHGVVADAFYMSFRAYKGRTFLLGVDDLTVGTLSNWADRLMALMEAGDHIAAISLATAYYAGSVNNVTVGLPDDNSARHQIVRERLLGMLTASMNYTLSRQDDGREERLRELANVTIEACIKMGEMDYLFENVFEAFEDADEADIFVTTLEPLVIDGDITSIPPDVVKSVVSYFISENQSVRLEELLCRLDPLAYDIDQITTLCRQHSLYDALVYVWTDAIGDFVTPLVDLLSLVQMLKLLDDSELEGNPYYESAMKVFPFLAFSLTGRRYPSGDIMNESRATEAKADLYGYLFSGKTTAWPSGSKNVLRTNADARHEPAFPYLVLLLTFDAASFLSMLNEAFEDPFLNESEEESLTNGVLHANGSSRRLGHTMTRQYILSIMLDVMQQTGFSADQTIYLDMFVARSLPKYPEQLVLSGTLLNNVLQRLCDVPVEELRNDCQLSVEYLLSAYRPPDVPALIRLLKEAGFFRVLKSVYRREHMYNELLQTFFQDPEEKYKVFDCISSCLRQSSGNQKQLQAFKRTIGEHIGDLAAIDVVRTSQTLALYAEDMLQLSVTVLPEPYLQFMFLRALLEPQLLGDERSNQLQALPLEKQSLFTELYVQLMCSHDPAHVADYVSAMPTGNLRLDQVIPAMEESGVVDAAVILLARDGLTRDAMERLTVHLGTLQQALAGLIVAAQQDQSIDAAQEGAEDLVEAVQKYVKVGTWLCQGQSDLVTRPPRPTLDPSWEVSEGDLDLDEYLWLNLTDAVVQITKVISEQAQHFETHPEAAVQGKMDLARVVSSLRSVVQQTFTALMAATATTSQHRGNGSEVRTALGHVQPSFLRILRAFLKRAAIAAPTLSDLRAVLADIFAAYTFEQDVLSLANGLLGSHVFADIERANQLRQRGWRPRAQVCEGCKRRAWGTGIGEIAWDAWMAREQEREAAKARRSVERSGGVEARRLSRGKAKADVGLSVDSHRDAVDEDKRKLTLVVFACRHVFHRICLDPDYSVGKSRQRELYRCPVCAKTD